MQAHEYLDKIAARHGADGTPLIDSRVADLLEITRQAISRFRRYPTATFDDEVSVRVAELLGLPPEHVLADMAAQRARSPAVAAVWRRIMKSSGGIAAGLCLLVGFALAGLTLPPAAQAHAMPQTIYYVKWLQTGLALTFSFITMGLWLLAATDGSGQLVHAPGCQK